MDLTKRELENRLNAPIQSMQNKEQQRLKSEQNKSLQEFVNVASEKVSKLRSDANNAQSSFKVQFFTTKITQQSNEYGLVVWWQLCNFSMVQLKYNWLFAF